MKKSLIYILFIFGSCCLWGQSLQSTPQLDKYAKDFMNFNIQTGGIKVSPNPFEDYILIKGIVDSYDVKVYDILGEEIFNFLTQGTSAGLSTNSYPSGVYLIELTPLAKNGLEKRVFKMIKL